MIHRGYRYKLAPTSEQERLFTQSAGVCRLVYNLALEQRRDHWRNYRNLTGKSINFPSQSRELTLLREEYDWIGAVHITPLQQVLRDLDRNYKSFFKGSAGYPKPRKKGLHDGFRLQGREFQFRKLNAKWSEVRFPKIGWVRYRDTRPIVGKLNNGTISKYADGWYISFSISIDCDAPSAHRGGAVGVDRGVATTLALSTGETMSLPRSIEELDRRKKRFQRALSRRKQGSKRYRKAKNRVASIQAKQVRIRKDWHHRVSLDLSRRFGTVVIEDLKVQRMVASARGTVDAPGRNIRQKSGLNRTILNQGWHTFETLLGYKLEERGGYLCKVPAHYTSQTCSECGVVDKRSRKNQASFSCCHCGHQTNADTNAAINILRRNTASMVVEDGYCPTFEATIRKGMNAPKNPTAELSA